MERVLQAVAEKFQFLGCAVRTEVKLLHRFSSCRALLEAIGFGVVLYSFCTLSVLSVSVYQVLFRISNLGYAAKDQNTLNHKPLK